MSCIDYAPPNPQDDRTPLMVAAGAGHLLVAELLLETHQSNVNEEDSKVSGWEVMGGLCEQLPCAREAKGEFFARLQETVGSVARGDVLIVMEDLKSRVGNVTEVWEEILGKHGEVACNDNGGRLLQFCSENNLVVSNSWFQHK